MNHAPIATTPLEVGSFGDRLKAARLSRGMTKADAARSLGVAQAIYRPKEGAATCTLDTAVKLSAVFDVSLDYLAGRSEDLGAARLPVGAIRASSGFGARLKTARNYRRMTQAKLAQLTGLALGGIGRLEASDNSTLATSVKCAEALGVSLDYLAGLADAEVRTMRREMILRQIAELQAELEAA